MAFARSEQRSASWQWRFWLKKQTSSDKLIFPPHPPGSLPRSPPSSPRLPHHACPLEPPRPRSPLWLLSNLRPWVNFPTEMKKWDQLLNLPVFSLCHSHLPPPSPYYRHDRRTPAWPLLWERGPEGRGRRWVRFSTQIKIHTHPCSPFLWEKRLSCSDRRHWREVRGGRRAAPCHGGGVGGWGSRWPRSGTGSASGRKQKRKEICLFYFGQNFDFVVCLLDLTLAVCYTVVLLPSLCAV